jgi:hypothetical protein
MVMQSLGGRPITATLDETGRNPGNWTIQVTEADFNINVPQFEVYHIYVSTTQMLEFLTQPITGQFQVWINGLPWDNVPYSANNSWDPSQPMKLKPGDEVDFFFSFGNGTAPIVTLWLQYDDGT